MLFVSVLHHYLIWHYSRAFAEIFHVFKNFFWFTSNFFSLKQLLRSYFSPWRRITEERGRTFSFEDLASYLIINLISRIIGFILRTVIILTGLAPLIILCLLVVMVYIAWVMAPLLIFACLYFGIKLLF
jgi:hypothetical protein